MARFLVDVQLEILVVVHETPTDLVDCQMEWILREKIIQVDFSCFLEGFSHLLIDQVGVITMGERCFHLNHLTSHLRNRWSGNKIKTARSSPVSGWCGCTNTSPVFLSSLTCFASSCLLSAGSGGPPEIGMIFKNSISSSLSPQSPGSWGRQSLWEGVRSQRT